MHRRPRRSGQQWVKTATNSFNLGGLIGTLADDPGGKISRPQEDVLYLLPRLRPPSLMAAFGLDLDPHTRLYMYFPIGLTVFGVFGSFTYYLPELFPTRLRGTGAGFTYNIGRLFAAVGPFLVGSIAAAARMRWTVRWACLFWVGIVPVIGHLSSCPSLSKQGAASCSTDIFPCHSFRV